MKINIINKIFQIDVTIIMSVAILLSIILFTLGILHTDFNIFKDSYGQIGHGHDLPPSLIGDREIFLNFNKSELKSVTEKNIINLALIDNKTGNNVPHVTFIISIYDQHNKNKFTANLHGHDGKIRLEFINTEYEGYDIHANYDTLAASYVSDYGSPIKIDGSVFNEPGKYKVKTEITGIDFDNTFLQEPLKYEYRIEIK